MNEAILIALIVLVLINIAITWFKVPNIDISNQLKEVTDLMRKFDDALDRTEKSIKDEFQRNRTETNDIATNNREELTKTLGVFSDKFSKDVKEFNDLLRQKFNDFSSQQTKINKQTTDNVKEVKDAVDKQLKSIRDDNTKQLDKIRNTVDEKLQKTLNERISQSFESVGKQLKLVQEGLGEMKNLASDVGGLKKVLSNVKLRGGIGEVQLEMLLEQILSPDQYEANVKTKEGGSGVVEFAIKLPGRGDTDSIVWLPIDAKFPKDKYERLVDAYESGDIDVITPVKKEMEKAIKNMAKDIRDKYIDPPNTTDFGIMFLPFEGIYAEVVRNTLLIETLYRDFRVIVAGPTNLAAILNSLQMGFKTLAIEKRSSEVWQVLGAVKKEFESFGGMMGKAQKHIQTGLNQLDEVMGKRTRAIQRKLKDVETLTDNEVSQLLPELSDSNLLDEGKEEQKENGSNTSHFDF